MMMILSSWALDSFHVQFVPRSMHDSVASMIDSGRQRFPTNSLPTSVDTIVAHNPLDDSPVTFGSVVLLGIICAVGLAAMALTAGPKNPE
jgi:hypothetical protein